MKEKHAERAERAKEAEKCMDLPVKPLILRYVTAYIPSQLLAFVYVWSGGLRESLAKTAYRDIWINFKSNE